MLDILTRYSEDFLSGALVTLQLAAIVWLGGLAAGLLLGIWRSTLVGLARKVDSAVGMIFAAIPVLVILLWFHYPLQGSLNIVIDPFITAAFVLSVYNALIISDQIRGSIEDFPRSLRAAAAVNGVSKWDFRVHIMMPIVFRSALPGYLVSQVSALHLTLFASLISVSELFRVAQRINAIEYRAIEVFSLLALFYFVLACPLLIISLWAQRVFTLPGQEQ